MTISKKLSIAIVLALGVQLSAGAFSNNDIFIKNENAQILTFAQDLRCQNSTEAQKVAQWLDQQVIGESAHHNREAIIDIITNYNLTEKSKLTLLSELMEQQNSKNKKYAAQRFVKNVCAGIFFTGAGILCALAIIEDITNPKPRYYYVKPKKTVRVRVTHPCWPHETITYTYL